MKTKILIALLFAIVISGCLDSTPITISPTPTPTSAPYVTPTPCPGGHFDSAGRYVCWEVTPTPTPIPNIVYSSTYSIEISQLDQIVSGKPTGVGFKEIPFTNGNPVSLSVYSGDTMGNYPNLLTQPNVIFPLYSGVHYGLLFKDAVGNVLYSEQFTMPSTSAYITLHSSDLKTYTMTLSTS